MTVLITFLAVLMLTLPVFADAAADANLTEEVALIVPDCDEGTIVVEDALGFVCVPEGVENVVALEWTYVENLLALGIQPIAVADIEGYNAWVNIALELSEDVIDVGTRQAPNLELIMSLEPDLIIAATGRLGENYEALSAIAPVLAFDAYPLDITHYEEMIQTFNAIATATEREAEAEAVLEEMEAYFVEIQELLDENERLGEPFILAQTYATGDAATFRLFTSNALGVEILQQIGFENVWTDDPQPYGFTTVDFEAFVDIEDVNFFYIAQEDFNEVLIASPLWEALPFVASERAYWLGGDVWLFGGPLSMAVLIDTILEAMDIVVEEVPASE
jgi:ABC-type Fe3+-hydroxamate transport system substrate-binding protein